MSKRTDPILTVRVPPGLKEWLETEFRSKAFGAAVILAAVKSAKESGKKSVSLSDIFEKKEVKS